MLLLLFIILLATLPIFFILLPHYHKKTSQSNPPPGPKGLPIIGNLHQFDPLFPHLYMKKLAKIYGPILSLRLGKKSMVVIQSAKTAKQVLKTQDLNFCSRPPLVGQQKLSYNGLDIAFVPYDDYFREMKKVCFMHLFSSKMVQSFAPVRYEEISRMLEKISALASASEIVNLSHLAMGLSDSVICRISFGRRYHDEGGEGSRYHNLLLEAQAMLTAFYFSDYFPAAIGGLLDRLTGISSKLNRVFKEMDAFYEEIINEHLQQINKPDQGQESIIDVLLRLQKEQSFPFELTFDHIKGVLMDIIVAGTDTSTIMVLGLVNFELPLANLLYSFDWELPVGIKKDDIDMKTIPGITMHKREPLRLVARNFAGAQ